MLNPIYFHSNGKLLITGEYLVLKGAKALAIPSLKGQSMEVKAKSDSNSEISWKAYDEKESLWFETSIDYTQLKSRDNGNEAQTLLKILSDEEVQKAIHQYGGSYEITTRLQFHLHWGLGTSSTIISNIAEWLQIDAFRLQEKIFGGSGYDIACAQRSHPLIYQKMEEEPSVEEVNLNEKILPHLYFVSLDKKINSREAIADFDNKEINNSDIDSVSFLTEALLEVEELETFQSLITKHNQILSKILNQEDAQSIFPDFEGVVKYLGAWGGDFLMAVSEQNPKSYFRDKGYPNIFTYTDLLFS